MPTCLQSRHQDAFVEKVYIKILKIALGIKFVRRVEVFGIYGTQTFEHARGQTCARAMRAQNEQHDGLLI
jgi:hypothetical protein